MNTFLTENPKAIVLVNPAGVPIATASNVSPELNIVITSDRGEFEDEAKSMPFDSTRPSTTQS